MWKSKKLYLYLLPFICFCGLLGLSKNANAETYDVSAFGLYGQKTYGSSNVWQSGLGYAGTTMHSVYQWEVQGPNLSAQQAGKYGAVTMSGLINIPPDFYVNTNQGFRIVQCAVGGNTATLSNVRTSWVVNDAMQGRPPQIVWAIEAQLEFDTNNISGRMLCTMSSNNGVYFLQHTTTGYGTVSFGTTNFNATFSNTLSDELLQQLKNQNRYLIEINEQIRDGIGQTTDAVNNLTDKVTDPTVTGNFNTSPIQPFGPIGTITNSILELPRVVLNISPCRPLNPRLPYVNENIEIPCPSTFLNGMAGDFMTFLDVIASAGVWFITARYIFKKVQKLRDPENTDEEYLDI